MYSGWEQRLPSAERFFNIDDSGVPHFPGFDPEAARFLVQEREIVGIGVDTVSLDHGATTDNGAHLAVLGAGAYGLENLSNLHKVSPPGSTALVGGPTHEGASGGPSRVLAFCDCVSKSETPLALPESTDSKDRRYTRC